MRLAALALALTILPASGRSAEPRVVEITAHRFAFAPSEITLKRDEPVVLRLRTQDVAHGFYLKPLGIDAIIEPGKDTDVPLTPRVAGRYTIICDHFCGSGHGGMKMTLVVE